MSENSLFYKGMPRPPGAGRKAGQPNHKQHVAELWERCKGLGFDAEYPDPATGEIKKFRINNPFDALSYIAMTGRDPRFPHVLADQKKKLEALPPEPGTPEEIPGPSDKTRRNANQELLYKGYLLTEHYLGAVKLLLPYMRSKLAGMVEVTGENGGPLSANVDVVKHLSKLPGMRKMMEEVTKSAATIIEADGETPVEVVLPSEDE